MIPVTSVADDIEVSRSSAIDSYQWLREVYITKLLQNPIVLFVIRQSMQHPRSDVIINCGLYIRSTFFLTATSIAR